MKKKLKLINIPTTKRLEISLSLTCIAAYALTIATKNNINI